MSAQLPDAEAQGRDRHTPSGDTARSTDETAEELASSSDGKRDKVESLRTGGKAGLGSGDQSKIDPLRVLVWGAFVALVVLVWIAIALGVFVLV